MKTSLSVVVLLAAVLAAALRPGFAASSNGDASADLGTPPAASLPPGAESPDPGPSQAIFGPQQIPLYFSHKTHTEKVGKDCLSCHPRAGRSDSLADSGRLLDVAVCDGCHGSNHADRAGVRAGPDDRGQCAHCHVGYRTEDHGRTTPLRVPRANLRFDHKVHFDRRIGCGQCHGDVAQLDLATRDQLPRMRGCFRCHQMVGPARGEARGECTTCHLRTRGGTMVTSFEQGSLSPPAWLHGAQHGPDFVATHKRVGAEEGGFCAACHTERFCMDCHDGRVRPRAVHPNDWISMHGVAGQKDSPRCSSCHNDQGFCVPCHMRAGVTMSGPKVQGRRFHPPAWANLSGARRSGDHGWEARRNLEACVSCHTERDCAICHASSGRRGLGVDPHPPGFVMRCRSLWMRNSRPCLVCHEAASQELSRCN